MDLSKQFTKESEIQPGVSFTFRRLNVAQRASLELELTRQMAPLVIEQQKLVASGAGESEVSKFGYLAWASVTMPITLRTVLRSVTGIPLECKPPSVDLFLDSPDTPLALLEEAYSFAVAGFRMNSQELGEWLSRGTLQPQETASATSTGAITVSESGSTAAGTVGDTSPIA